MEYKLLIEQCWDANPSKRPDIYTLDNKIKEMKKSYYENEQQEISNDIKINNTNTSNNANFSSVNSLARKFSKIHIYEDLPEPRNATEGKFLKFSDLL